MEPEEMSSPMPFPGVVVGVSLGEWFERSRVGGCRAARRLLSPTDWQVKTLLLQENPSRHVGQFLPPHRMTDTAMRCQEHNHTCDVCIHRRVDSSEIYIASADRTSSVWQTGGGTTKSSPMCTIEPAGEQVRIMKAWFRDR
jgi:hypothetical protein